MMLNPTAWRISILSLAIALMSPPALAADPAPLRIHGAITLTKAIAAKAPELQTKHNITLATVPNTSGRGLEDLVSGKCDAAIVGGALKATVDIINAKTPNTVDFSKLKEFHVLDIPLAIVIHPSNTTPAITGDQLKSLFTGKIKNWKELGGPDEAVMLVIPQPSDGSRTSIQAAVLGADAFAKDARVLNTSPDINKVVTQVPGAVGFMTLTNKAAELKTLTLDKPVAMPCSVITLGEPVEPLKSLIATIQENFK